MTDALDIGNQVLMRDHHPLGCGRRARCVLEKRHIVGTDLGVVRSLSGRGQSIHWKEGLERVHAVDLTPEQILEIYKERYSEAEKEPPFRL